ncbi:GDP-D-glucose phosphorylase 1 isoform X3 [Hydra vulgaris]|uniref:GDP-D-glucose phosphorylase 1 n=1 Tax=Hydra vulgaris TaxID=6087 RepID=A0ABM4BFP2_HYDVU
MVETFMIKELNFVYSSSDKKTKSEFDDYLCNLWEKAMSAGYFWYKLDHIQQRCLGGTYNICAQLNENRFANRRPPQSATNVVMPFDNEKFNFTKIHPREILFELKSEDKVEIEKSDLIIINVSPIDYGHVLLVPDSKSGMPQVINQYGIVKATQLCLLSTDKRFCIGYNSLCALASVNHQHFHILFVDHILPISKSKVQWIGKELFILKDYMVNGLALQLTNQNIDIFVRNIIIITDFFCKNNIAHNLFMCKSLAFDGSDLLMVTVFLFPKVPLFGEKETRLMNSCCFDLAGYILLKEKEEYDTMTEEKVLKILNHQTYQNEQFQVLCNKILLKM